MIAHSGTIGMVECGCSCLGCGGGNNWHCCGTGCSHVEFTTTRDDDYNIPEPTVEDEPPKKKPKPKTHYTKNKKPWEL